ncbi:MAG TPA: hypothetical protein VGX28_01510 [Frankiaceae bacterium]|nr:hypothetical protein [Frankiaceae bacterium]
MAHPHRLWRLVLAALCLSPQIATAATQGKPIPLASTVLLRGTSSASVDVSLDRPVTLSGADLFDPASSVFDADRVGAGYALVSLRYAYNPPTLVGVVTPQAGRGRRIQLAFGDDRSGRGVLESLRLPAGPYRLYLFTPGGATTVRFRLPGLAGGTRTVTPVRREAIRLHRADAPPLTLSGSVLADARDLEASQTLAIATVAARITAPRGYESYWCADDGGDPPAGRYLPHCIGAEAGAGVGNALPAVNFEYSGLSAFIGLPRGRWGVSRSVEAVGQIADQTSYFVWIPMPFARPNGVPATLTTLPTFDVRRPQLSALPVERSSAP